MRTVKYDQGNRANSEPIHASEDATSSHIASSTCNQVRNANMHTVAEARNAGTRPHSTVVQTRGTKTKTSHHTLTHATTTNDKTNNPN